MAVFNNLVMYDQNVAQNTVDSIVPDLATSWEWNADKSRLTFKVRQGVKWHDGQAFTAKDVKCTFDMVRGKVEGQGPTLRKSPRDAWYNNVDRIELAGDYEVAFQLKRPQPSLLALLASGYSPVYPCHVPPNAMRSKPIGTGPFKFVEFRHNDSIKLAKNPDYWKKGRPYLDGIEYRIIQNRSTRMLAFIAGEFDMTFPTDVSVPLLKEIRSQAPHAQCTMRPSAVAVNLIVNRDTPPFDNADIRKALALTLDRKAFIDALAEGEALQGGTMLPPPAGVWGMPPEMLADVLGYGDVKKNREEGRALMRKAGYGPEKKLKTKVSTRNIATFRDPAVILIDQLREVYVEAELDVIDTSVYYNKVFKKDYTVGLNLTGSAVDDPDQNFYENYACGSLRNYTNYCNPALEKLFEQQSQELDLEKRKRLVWDIDRQLQEDVARPIISHGKAAGCWQPHVKGLTIHVNSIYNGWRFEDVWIDK
jgi:peptide/nickel transport system substrate-binding protein